MVHGEEESLKGKHDNYSWWQTPNLICDVKVSGLSLVSGLCRCLVSYRKREIAFIGCLLYVFPLYLLPHRILTTTRQRHMSSPLKGKVREVSQLGSSSHLHSSKPLICVLCRDCHSIRGLDEVIWILWRGGNSRGLNMSLWIFLPFSLWDRSHGEVTVMGVVTCEMW